MKVGFIGLGNIGLPMTTSILRSGAEVVAFDLDPARVAKAVEAGARGAIGPAEAIAAVDAVVTMVPAGEHSRRVYLDDGVIASAPAGSILIDCSTVDIATERALKAAAAAAGHDIVDAPVSGGPLRAAEGKLTITVGGTERAFERAAPVLAMMASSVHHMGAGGAGLAAKICNNLVLGIELAGLSEAFALGGKLRLDPGKLVRALSSASGGSRGLREVCLLKDLGIAQAAAQLTGVPFPMGAAALSLYTQMKNAGHGDLDVCGVIKMYEETTDRAPMPEKIDVPAAAADAPEPLSFASLRTGDEYWSRAFRFDLDDVVAFAREWDPQYYHTDQAAAANSIFGRLSVSGIHTFAVSQRIFNELWLFRRIGLAGAGMDNLRWRRPVYPGDTIRVRGRIAEVRPKDAGRAIVVMATDVVNQDDVVVMKYDLNVLVRTVG